MGIFGNYPAGIANLEAMSRARTKVIDEGMARQAHLRADPLLAKPISCGNGRIVNILV